jgi:hypothetical protein
MRHTSYVKGCRVCEINAWEVPSPGGIVFENDLWLVRHAPPPYSVPGWMMLHTQRHNARWYGDESFARAGGQWTYLCRAVDATGQVINVLLMHSQRGHRVSAREGCRSLVNAPMRGINRRLGYVPDPPIIQVQKLLDL